MASWKAFTLRVLGFALVLGTAVELPAEVWMTAPQLCRGRPYSAGARAAQWQFDAERGVSVATRDSPIMYASVFPGEGSDFVLKMRMQLRDHAESKVILGMSTFYLTNFGEQTELRFGGQSHTFENTIADNRTWTEFTVRRRNGHLTAAVNGHLPVSLGDNNTALEKIGLGASQGSIAVHIFSLTGDLQRN